MKNGNKEIKHSGSHLTFLKIRRREFPGFEWCKRRQYYIEGYFNSILKVLLLNSNRGIAGASYRVMRGCYDLTCKTFLRVFFKLPIRVFTGRSALFLFKFYLPF